jgi:hypothetical protein
MLAEKNAIAAGAVHLAMLRTLLLRKNSFARKCEEI